MSLLKRGRSRWVGLLLTLLLLLPAVPTMASDHCTSTPDGTALLVDPVDTVTGTVDATGCDIGVYFSPGSTGTVDGADIFGAKKYGVFNRAGEVTVVNSQVHDIGDSPLSGNQYGVAILFRATTDGSATPSGAIHTNRIWNYQKNGITLMGGTASIIGNTVLGDGQITRSAQNGIQVSGGASATVANNTITGNWWVGVPWTATGILIYLADDVKVVNNTVTDNQAGIYAIWSDKVKLIGNRITGSYADDDDDWSLIDWENEDSKVHANKFE